MRRIIFFLAAGMMISVLAKTQSIPNGSFESWSVVNGSMQPDNWLTTDIPQAPSITKETPGYSSYTACRISEVTYAGYNFAGFIAQSFAYTGLPASIIGYYKLFPSSGDSVSVIVNVILSKNKEAIGGGSFVAGSKSSSSSFSSLLGSIEYMIKGATPDSAYISVLIYSKNQTPGSSVVIDGLEFSNITGVHNYSNIALAGNIYPNPVKDILNIPVKVSSPSSFRVGIYNLAGVEVKDYSYSVKGSEVLSIPVSDIDSGAYFISILSDKGQRQVKKFILVN